MILKNSMQHLNKKYFLIICLTTKILINLVFRNIFFYPNWSTSVLPAGHYQGGLLFSFAGHIAPFFEPGGPHLGQHKLPRPRKLAFAGLMLPSPALEATWGGGILCSLNFTCAMFALLTEQWQWMGREGKKVSKISWRHFWTIPLLIKIWFFFRKDIFSEM
jgi:hypothetical protein